MTEPNHIAEARKKVSRPQIREAFLRNGAHIEPGHDDLPDYVYESVFELLEMAAPAVRGEEVAEVNASDDGMWADILPDVTLKLGQILYAAPQAEQPGLQEKLKVAYWDFDAMVKGIKPYSVPCGQPEHAFIVSVMAALEAPQPAAQQPVPDVPGLIEALRQYQHSDGSGLVFGYDKLLVDQHVAGLVEALEGLLGVIGESRGVFGYHLNGEIAEWDEFLEVHDASAALATYRKGGA